MRELEDSLAQVRNAWIAGRSALDAAAQPWREAIGADELALLALAGHATDVLTRQTPAGLTGRPLLPALSAPSIPAALRSRFRRLLATPKNAPSLERPLITLAAARGYTAHPADWLPDAKDDWAPDVYGPWLDWVRADERACVSEDEITADTYDAWSWTERRKALERLRAENPEAALAIVAAKAASEPAERRVRLIELLATRLSDADADYLETLAKDRSDRVQALARAFLARLGRGTDAGALATELADMVELGKVGLLSRKLRLRLKALKTPAQALRRLELFRLVSAAQLAAALGVSEQQLLEGAPDGAPQDVFAFVTCVAETGSDVAVRALIEAMLGGETPLLGLRELSARLTDHERRALLPAVMKHDNDLLLTTLAVAGGNLGQTSRQAFAASPHHAALKASAEASAHSDDEKRRSASAVLDQLLPRLGLLLDAPGARAILHDIAAWGPSPADPRLDMLHFNAALTSETPP